MSILPTQSDEKKQRKPPCQPPPPYLTRSRLISALKFKQGAFSLWPAVGDTTNKECAFLISHIYNRPHSFRGRRGRLLSTEFMLLSSKRHYVDYYRQIQNMVTLYEIKSWIETENHADPDAVRWDLELCFKNAKVYDMKDSPIWKDAKHLHVCWRHQSVIYATRQTSLRNLSTTNASG